MSGGVIGLKHRKLLPEMVQLKDNKKRTKNAQDPRRPKGGMSVGPGTEVKREKGESPEVQSIT